MAQVTVVYWRDMPAQVLVGRGRRAVKAPLSERFEQAIDRAAMKSGAAGTEDYLEAWRKGAPLDVEGDDATAAQTMLKRLETEYDSARLKTLIENGGHAPETKD
ncbi:MAG: virulence factor [Maritimibacter sp.]